MEFTLLIAALNDGAYAQLRKGVSDDLDDRSIEKDGKRSVD